MPCGEVISIIASEERHITQTGVQNRPDGFMEGMAAIASMQLDCLGAQGFPSTFFFFSRPLDVSTKLGVARNLFLFPTNGSEVCRMLLEDLISLRRRMCT